MKSVAELYAMNEEMKNAILEKREFVFNGKPFSREDWLDMVDEQDGVRICAECGELMTDGYLLGESETICSIECLENFCGADDEGVKELKNAIKNNLDYDDDMLFFTEWEELN